LNANLANVGTLKIYVFARLEVNMIFFRQFGEISPLMKALVRGPAETAGAGPSSSQGCGRKGGERRDCREGQEDPDMTPGP
jgi:hypothetical protein